ncbi:MAG: acetoacetate decarboxylase [Alphaproteobacteria bacterium]
MKRSDILSLPSMPAASPVFPRGPYRFVNREYLIITYESDPDAVRAALPEPLVPTPNALVAFEAIRMPDSSGFGDYTESGLVIPCTFNGDPCGFVAQMYLDDEAPIAAGREIWGFPKKYGNPKFRVAGDTLTGTVDYGGERVAMGTMVYKPETDDQEIRDAQAAVGKTQICLKVIPDADGSPAIAQLVGYNMTDITVKGAWRGPARLHLIPHVNAPFADLPVRRVVGGKHILADITLPFGRVVHDYLAAQDEAAEPKRKSA